MYTLGSVLTINALCNFEYYGFDYLCVELYKKCFKPYYRRSPTQYNPIWPNLTQPDLIQPKMAQQLIACKGKRVSQCRRNCSRMRVHQYPILIALATLTLTSFSLLCVTSTSP